jgi:hypothetical protein
MYVLDMKTNDVHPRPAKAKGSAGNPGRFSGWRRVDGRVMHADAPARTPFFRPGAPK